MSWQPVPRIDQSGAYGDPFAMHAGGGAPQIMPSGLSAEEQHFFSSCTTREYEEMARRKAEHMESCLLYTSPSPRDLSTSRMPSSA